MPLAQISILEGRSEAMVKDMAEAVTDAISKTLSAPREKIRVVVTEVPAARWFVAGQSIAQQVASGAGRESPSRDGVTGRPDAGV